MNRTRRRRIGYGTSAANVDNTPDLVDLDDGQTRKFLQGDTNGIIVLPDVVFTVQKAGTLATSSTASGLVVVAPRAFTLYRVVASVGTAPTGAAILVDVKKVAAGGNTTDAGTTIFTTSGRRPSIAISGTTSSITSTTVGVPEVSSVALGDILRVEIAQIGSGTAGSDLVVQLFGY